MNRKLIVDLFLVIALLFSFSLVSACSNLADQSSFTGADSNKEIVLCNSIYNQPVTISGVEKFTLNCDGSTLDSGISVSNSLRVTIENCVFSGAMGIQLNEVQQSQIRNNDFIGNQNGISAKGLSVSSINGNNFDGNTIALKLENSNRNSISLKNIFTFNQVSIDIVGSTENTISKNIFKNSVARVEDESVNSWDVNREGNYWSDYSGTDVNQDGIGDTPYSIDSVNADNYPFSNENIEKVENNALAGNAVWRDKSLIVGAVVERDEEFTLKIGDAKEFICGKNTTYKLSLAQTTPELIFNLNGKPLSFAGFAANQLDVNNDQTYDVNVIVRAYGLDSANIRIIRLNPCMNYCGDGICSAGETKCTEDCIDQAKLDGDNDGYTIEAGDCDDSSATVHPGAEEQCGTVDTDCDGWIGEADTDCQGLGAGFWFLIVFFLIAVGASIVVYFWKGKSEEQMEETFEGEEEVVEETREPVAVRDVSTKVRRIMDYAENYFTKGYSAEQVKEILVAEGWSSEDIDAAVEKLVSAGSETVGSRPKEASSLDKLRQTIQKDLDSGKSKSEIINTLKEKGWEDRVIKVIFKDVKTNL